MRNASAVLVFLTASLTACAEEEPQTERPAAAGGSEATAAVPIDPCSLLSREEVSQVVGAGVEQLERSESAYTSHHTCSYWGDVPLSVMVAALAPTYHPDADHYRSQEQDVRETYQKVEFIDGLGSAAMWLEEAGMLHAVVPGYEVIIVGTKPHAMALMETALAHLP